ncbi:hypothetical protein ES703_87377 [subsurface metagenome]
MARTHAKKQMKKDPSFRKTKPLTYLPVQRKMQLGVSGSPGTFSATFDSGRLLSQQNHRLYRYGKRYTQKIDVDPSALTPGSTVDVWALADTWMVQKAFEEAATVFKRAYTDERENLTKEARARWFDFRVTSGITATDMYAAVDGNPTSAGFSLIVNGEIVDSVVEDAAGVTRTFTWAGATTASSYSLMNEYNLAGNTSGSPGNPTGSGPYDDLEADASAVEMQALQANGNFPPYDANNLPSVWVKIATLTVGSAGNQKISTGYFDAPCGLVYLKSTGQTIDSLNNNISVTVQSGDYKGVKAHNMERV